MKSPFPGMDPYLVRRWSNVHVLMMGIMAGALKRVLPRGLEARPEEHVRIEAMAGERMRGFQGDVAVIDARRLSPPHATGSAATVAEPILVEFHRGPIVVRNIEIVDVKDGDRVITAIEVLSHGTNWRGASTATTVANCGRTRTAAQTGWRSTCCEARGRAWT